MSLNNSSHHSVPHHLYSKRKVKDGQKPIHESVSLLRPSQANPTHGYTALIRYFLWHPTRIIPRVLRLSRNRTLRHWTIQRAWSVFQARKRRQQQLELERQWMSMRSACEDLRTGIGEGGRLYRQAMSKKGVYGGRSDLEMNEDSEGRVLPGESGRVERGRESGIPIEYGKGLTDTPPRDAWDESWTR
jgi:large subunit ribosomal protein L40